MKAAMDLRTANCRASLRLCSPRRLRAGALLLLPLLLTALFPAAAGYLQHLEARVLQLEEQRAALELEAAPYRQILEDTARLGKRRELEGNLLSPGACRPATLAAVRAAGGRDIAVRAVIACTEGGISVSGRAGEMGQIARFRQSLAEIATVPGTGKQAATSLASLELLSTGHYKFTLEAYPVEEGGLQ